MLTTVGKKQNGIIIWEYDCSVKRTIYRDEEIKFKVTDIKHRNSITTSDTFLRDKNVCK
jgi:hypothetical protein